MHFSDLKVLPSAKLNKGVMSKGDQSDKFGHFLEFQMHGNNGQQVLMHFVTQHLEMLSKVHWLKYLLVIIDRPVEENWRH